MISTTVIITIDTRRKKKDGTYPLILRLHHNRRTISIPTGHSIEERNWDDLNKVVKKNHVGVETVTRLNNIIQKKRNEAIDVLLKLHEDNKLDCLSITELKEVITGVNDNQSFFQYGDYLVTELLKANRIGTARSYKGVLSILRKYCKGRELSFKDINYKFLVNFETYHRSNGNGTNGLGVYMRTIRAIFNKAVKERRVDKQDYPFENYKIRTAPTEKRALDITLLNKIIELNIKQGHGCFNARNYFVASYMMYGMNFRDMAFLKKTDIVDGRIRYRRNKTAKLYDIKVTSGLKAILEHYITKNEQSDYVFPILKGDTIFQQDKSIQWALLRYNKKLKELAKMCGIETNLSSYVSRHSFATQAMLLDVPLNAISSMLGHSSLKTTQVYLKSLPSNILDDYNNAILNRI